MTDDEPRHVDALGAHCAEMPWNPKRRSPSLHRQRSGSG